MCKQKCKSHIPDNKPRGYDNKNVRSTFQTGNIGAAKFVTVPNFMKICFPDFPITIYLGEKLTSRRKIYWILFTKIRFWIYTTLHSYVNFNLPLTLISFSSSTDFIKSNLTCFFFFSETFLTIFKVIFLKGRNCLLRIKNK